MADLGTIKGQITLDVKQALAAYTKTRLEHLNTVTALKTGGGALQASGAAMAGAGALMAGAFVGAISKAAEFEKRLDAFGAVSDTTAADMQKVRDKALQLGKDTKFSANEIADSFIEMGKQGRSAQDIINGLGDATANLASSSDLPLAQAAETLSNTLTTFGLKAKDAVHVSDLLSGSAAASSIDVSDLAVSFKYVSGVAASMGVSLEDTNTALGVLGNYGIKGSTAGTSLRQVLIALSGPTKKSAAQLMDLGIIAKDGSNAFYDATGKLKPLPDVIQTLSKSLEGMNAKEKYDALSRIFPVRAMPTILNLLKSGKKGFEDMNDAINRSDAATIASKRMDNLSGDIEILRGNIETMAIDAGSGFQQFARTVVQGITSILGYFSSLSQGTQTFILGFIGIAGAALIVVGGLGMFAGAILNIVGLAIQVKTAITGIRTVMAAWRAALLATSAAQWILNSAILANPITWIIVAIVAVVAALIWFFTQTKLGREIWANFVNFLKQAWTNIVNFATSVWSNLGNFFTSIWEGIKTGAQVVWNAILAFFTTIWNAIKFVFLNFTWLGLIISHFTQIKAFFVTIWNAILAFFTAVFTAIMAAAQPFIDFWMAHVAPMFQALGELIAAIFNFIWQTIVFAWNAIMAFVLPIVAAIVNGVVAYFQLWWNIVTTVMNAIWSVISAVWNAIVSFVTAVVATIVSFVVSRWNAMMATISAIMNGIRAVVSAVWNAISSVVSSVVNRVRSFISSGWNALVSIVSGIFNRVKEAIRAPLEAAISFISGIKDRIIGFFAGAGSWLLEAGKSIIRGLVDGIASMFDAVTSKLQSLTALIPKVKGPEDVDKVLLTPAGRLVMQGFMNGIDAMVPDLRKQLGGITEDIPGMFNANAGNLQASITATRDMAITASTPSINPMQTAIDTLSDKIESFMEDPRSVNVEVNNPKPEPASDSLPNSLRKVSSVI